jgi:GAF domain-containing protein
MALPLAVGEKVLGAITVQSTEERAFGEDDILTLQTMADHLAIAINNAQLLRALERANAELLRTKTYEALATATTQAVHWIGNKALPITTTIARIKKDLGREPLDIASIREDLDLIDESARLIGMSRRICWGQRVSKDLAPRCWKMWCRRLLITLACSLRNLRSTWPPTRP